MLAPISTLFLASTSLAYGLCDTVNYPASLKNASAAIVGSSTKSIVVGGANVAAGASGTISVIDGCSFSLKDFVLTGSSSIQFYGGSGESDLNAVRITADDIPASKTNGTFNFITTPGSAINWADFRQINLYDPIAKAVIGSCPIGGGNGVTQGAAPAGPRISNGPVATTTAGSASATNTKSGAHAMHAFAGLASLTLIMVSIC